MQSNFLKWPKLKKTARSTIKPLVRIDRSQAMVDYLNTAIKDT